MERLTERIRTTALDAGADLVGVAPISRFENAPPEFHPRAVFPPTRTVVAIALRMARGTLKAVEEGTYWQAYNCDSYWHMNEVEAPQILRRICVALEQDGYTGLPVHNPFQPHLGRRIREDNPLGPDGICSLRVIGVAAGLGEFGMSRFLLTPEYGPRQRIFAVFTDAELVPSPLFKGSVCDECLACARECQAGAIGDERTEVVTIDGRDYRHAPLDTTACARIQTGHDPRFSPFRTGEEEEGRQPAYNRFIQEKFHHSGIICAGRGCIRACMDHLEKTGRIAGRFHTPLIEGERWKLDQPPGSGEDR